MIPQTSPSRAVIEFDNDSKSGQLVFLRGVQGNKYYCKSATEALPIATSTLPTDPLTSAFSVSSTKQVKFSPGNLRYNRGSDNWSFAAHQYDCLNSYSQTGYQDLFSWGQNGLHYGGQDHDMDDYNQYKLGDSKLSKNNGEWGDVISGWRTLTQTEWDYMLNTNNSLDKRTATYRFAKATVCGVKGLIILPDSWDNSTTPSVSAYNNTIADFDVNIITTNEDWLNYQTKGAVFLPFYGFRQGIVIDQARSRYWSASNAPKNSNGNQCAYVLQFSNSSVSAGASGVRNEGAYVRLVKDI